jgi:hypothetical protein
MCAKKNHTIIEGQYINIDSVFTIKCEIHNEIFQTTARNYKRAKHGLPCCGKAAVIRIANQAMRDEKGRFKT